MKTTNIQKKAFIVIRKRVGPRPISLAVGVTHSDLRTYLLQQGRKLTLVPYQSICTFSALVESSRSKQWWNHWASLTFLYERALGPTCPSYSFIKMFSSGSIRLSVSSGCSPVARWSCRSNSESLSTTLYSRDCKFYLFFIFFLALLCPSLSRSSSPLALLFYFLLLGSPRPS